MARIFAGRAVAAVKRLAAVAAIAGGLAACHDPFVAPLPPQATFGAQDKDGLVVMGLHYAAAIPEDVFFVHWYRYDPVKQSVLMPLDSSDPVGWLPALTPKRSTHGYSVGRLPPGDYILGAATEVKDITVWGREGQDSWETRYFGTAASLASPVPMAFSTEARSVAQAALPRITVRPGEILYIGDYYFTVGPKHRARLARVASDLAGAEAALHKAYPNIQGTIEAAKIALH